ncbi:MAG: hypothetical protein ABMB14_08005 [Myxococcota bacterium]
MRSWYSEVLVVVALVAVGACGGKGKTKPASAGGSANDYAGGFVQIDFGDEEAALEGLEGSELVHDAVAECGDLLKLETAAIVGQLNEAQIRCLDGAIRQSDRQTVKDKVSRVLLNDAWAKGDEHRWEGIARRHLEEIDRSDPDMCYKFAYYLVDRGPEKMDEAMKWARVALDNRQVWEGDLHVKRVYALMKIETLAAQKKWNWLESEYTRKPSEAVLEQATEARNQTKTFAREWFEYARGSASDTTVPLEICQSAAGTGDFCQGVDEVEGDPTSADPG